MPMQHWCDSRHPRQPNNTSGYRSPASSRQGRSQEEKPSAKVVLKAAHCCHLPFKKICASLSSCLLGCPQKHTFSLLAKALCSSVFYSASLSISSWLLGLVSDTMFFLFFSFPLGFGISCVSLFYLSLLLPCLIHSSCGWLARLPSLCIMLRILGFLRNISKASGSLDGRGVWGRRVTYICMAKSLCFPSETITTLFFKSPLCANFPPIFYYQRQSLLPSF